MTEKQATSGLALLREPFKPHQISKLPKPTKKQTEEVRADFRKGIRCQICGTWHHPDVVHLDYVGHAALTNRLLDADPNWNWEPVAWSDKGGPALDENGGMWIKLTVCGQTRLGYGHPDGKRGGNAIKEVIGDALRNAAMRFGAALDLWHNGDLHADDDTPEPPKQEVRQQAKPAPKLAPDYSQAINYLGEADTLHDLTTRFKNLPDDARKAQPVIDAAAKRKAEIEADAEHDAAVKEY